MLSLIGRADAPDLVYMRLALVLAYRALPAPNPRVGAVVVRAGRIAGTGFHERAGGPHAEVSALRSAREQTSGATLYVTLEPCGHFGRTPPCVQAILDSGVRRVVIGCPDPNPNVRGGGASTLERAGIEVVRTGPWRAEAEALIADWVRARCGGDQSR